jgi:hypothetical protein
VQQATAPIRDRTTVGVEPHAGFGNTAARATALAGNAPTAASLRRRTRSTIQKTSAAVTHRTAIGMGTLAGDQAASPARVGDRAGIGAIGRAGVRSSVRNTRLDAAAALAAGGDQPEEGPAKGRCHVRLHSSGDLASIEKPMASRGWPGGSAERERCPQDLSPPTYDQNDVVNDRN